MALPLCVVRADGAARLSLSVEKPHAAAKLAVEDLRVTDDIFLLYASNVAGTFFQFIGECCARVRSGPGFRISWIPWRFLCFTTKWFKKFAEGE